MVHAISAQFPFMSGESLVLYQPSPMERYLPVAPGIAVSVEPQDEVRWEQERGQESSVYNRQGQMNHLKKKGALVDTLW
jgi:hypothetical protein